MKVLVDLANRYQVGVLEEKVLILKPPKPTGPYVELDVAEALNLAAHLISMAKTIAGAPVEAADVLRSIGIEQ